VNYSHRFQVGLAVLGLLSGAACNSVNSAPPSDPEALAAARAQLVAVLRAEGITDERVLAAIGRVPRHLFVLPHDRARAYADEALPIAGGQTISQPYIVALMTQLLELQDDARVLEIGTGSGYQAAVLALIARAVYSVEIDPALAQAAHAQLQRLGYANVSVRAGDGFYGWPDAAPFDAVIVTAVAPKVPEPLVAQLKPGGRLVMPLGDGEHQTLVRGRKRPDGTLAVERVAAVAFVPMRGAVRQPPPRSPSRTPEQ
jgi:protein-L-isoaspartate(D-aspartate) O-methyltransferase